MQYCRRLCINAKYNDLRALSGKICFTLLMAKMHFDIDEHRKFICCLKVKCLSKYIPRNVMDSCSFVSPTICSVLPRPFSKGGTPCRVLMTPCLFQEAEMTPCLFLVTPNDALLQFLFSPERHGPR